MNKLNYTNPYWNNRGKYQNIIHKVAAMLIHDSSDSPTIKSTIFESINAVYHDVYNNGGGNFYQLREQRQNIIKFLKSNSQHIPDFLCGTYDCDCKMHGDEFDDYFYNCECVTDVKLTQQIVDELGNITKFIIEYCLENEPL